MTISELASTFLATAVLAGCAVLPVQQDNSLIRSLIEANLRDKSEIALLLGPLAKPNVTSAADAPVRARHHVSKDGSTAYVEVVYLERNCLSTQRFHEQFDFSRASLVAPIDSPYGPLPGEEYDLGSKRLTMYGQAEDEDGACVYLVRIDQVTA